MAAPQDSTSALGVDIALASGDIQLAGNGDIALVSQLDMVAQRLYLLCVPDRGSVLLHPDVGAGLASAVQTPLRDTDADRIAHDVATVVQTDPAVTSVQDVVVEQPTPRALQITPVVTLVGGLALPLPLPQIV